MVVNVHTELPDSTLAPAQVAEKFQSTSMAGLGAAINAGWEQRRRYLNSFWAARYRYTALQGLHGLAQDDGSTTTINLPGLPTDTQAGDITVDAAGNLIDASTGQVLSQASAPLPSVQQAAQSAGIPVPSSNSGSAAWANFYTALAKGGFQLAQISAIKPGTVVTPQGGIYQQNPGYPIGTPGTAGVLTAGLNSGMVIVIALAAIFLLGRRQQY